MTHNVDRCTLWWLMDYILLYMNVNSMTVLLMPTVGKHESDRWGSVPVFIMAHLLDYVLDTS
jgi:hypothetical protein